MKPYQKRLIKNVLVGVILFVLAFLYHTKAEAQKSAIYIMPNVYKSELVFMKDGDSGFINVWLPSTELNQNFQVKTVEFRLFRVDTYEMRSFGSEDKELAQKGKKYSERALKQPFVIRYVGKDRYDRWLVYCYFRDGSDLAKMLKREGLTTGKYERAKSPEMERVYSN